MLWVNDTKRFNALQKIAVEESRLKIPLLFGLDVIHGYRTIFPIPIAMASSWDPSVHERAAEIAAREARAAGVHWTFAPMVDVARDARWGRIAEGAGEDPYLGAAMAAAQVRGFQGPYLGAPGRLLACAKHFAAYGKADGGRDYDPVYVSETELRNVYFPPFAAAAKAGVGSFMSAYMDLNELPAGANPWLLRDVLRGEWGFSGFVVSDAFGVANLTTQHFARDGRDAAARALGAGLDMDMASGTFAQNLAALVKDGVVKEARIDEAVRRILAVKVRLGLFEQPYADEARGVVRGRPPKSRAAPRAALSMVLLKNDKQPPQGIARERGRDRPLADSKVDTEGSWMVFGHVPAGHCARGAARPARERKVAHAPGRDPPRGAFVLRRLHPRPESRRSRPRRVRPPSARRWRRRRRRAVIAVMGERADMSGEAASRPRSSCRAASRNC